MTTATMAIDGIDLSMRGTALVRRSGRDVLRYAGGTTGAAPDEPIGLGTRFQIASISKQFTAAAVLVLADRGRLALDDLVVDHLEGCPEAWSAITLHHLLCHTSGLVHWPKLPDLDLTAAISPEQLLARFAAPPLLFAPGTRHAYSSPGYVLLAHVVERAGGRPYRDFLRDEIFQPLGMDATFAGNGGHEGALAAPLHEGEPVTSFELDVVGMGAGDVWSTVDDLSRWDAALDAGRLLSAPSRTLMLEPQAPVADAFEGVTFYGYGYGWYLADILGHRAAFHPGGNAGFQAINLTLPDDDARFVALTNDTGPDLLGIAMQLLAVAVGADR